MAGILASICCATVLGSPAWGAGVGEWISPRPAVKATNPAQETRPAEHSVLLAEHAASAAATSSVVPAGYVAGLGASSINALDGQAGATQGLRWLPVNRDAASSHRASQNVDQLTQSDSQVSDQANGNSKSSPNGSETEQATDKITDEITNVPVVFNAPVIDSVGALADDPMQDPFGDKQGLLLGPKANTVPPQPLPRVMSIAEEGGQREVLPPPPPVQGTPTPSDKLPSSVLQAPAQQPAQTLTPEKMKSAEELLRGMPLPPSDQRPMEEQLVQAPPLKPDQCPPLSRLKKVTDITNDIAAKPGKFPTECPLEGGEFQPRSWESIVFTWKASALCHKPLYFEQVAVERYGHNLGPILQPFASGAHFFLTFPILPYKMGLNPPNECMYSLGYYRPGSCAPWILDPLPLSVRAALAEGGVWTGMVFLIP